MEDLSIDKLREYIKDAKEVVKKCEWSLDTGIPRTLLTTKKGLGEKKSKDEKRFISSEKETRVTLENTQNWIKELEEELERKLAEGKTKTVSSSGDKDAPIKIGKKWTDEDKKRWKIEEELKALSNDLLNF